MSDPILDEQEILQDLHTPVSPETVARLQMAVVGAMCDIYDRKVTREQFCAMLGPCITMYGALSKLHTIDKVRTALRAGEVTEENLNATITASEDRLRTYIGAVRGVMKQLMECPTSEDKIH